MPVIPKSSGSSSVKATDSDNRRTKGNQSESVGASNATSTDVMKTWISVPIINTSTSPLIPTDVSSFTSDISVSNDSGLSAKTASATFTRHV